MKPPTFAAILLIPFTAASFVAPAGDDPVNDLVQTAESMPSVREVAAMASRFAPAEIRADVSSLPEG